MTVTTHAIKHCQSSMSVWPAGQLQLGFLFAPKEPGASPAVNQ
jgi:hypothetical protein